jgi:hypothetical protein
MYILLLHTCGINCPISMSPNFIPSAFAKAFTFGGTRRQVRQPKAQNYANEWTPVYRKIIHIHKQLRGKYSSSHKILLKFKSFNLFKFSSDSEIALKDVSKIWMPFSSAIFWQPHVLCTWTLALYIKIFSLQSGRSRRLQLCRLAEIRSATTVIKNL